MSAAASGTQMASISPAVNCPARSSGRPASNHAISSTGGSKVARARTWPAVIPPPEPLSRGPPDCGPPDRGPPGMPRRSQCPAPSDAGHAAPCWPDAACLGAALPGRRFAGLCLVRIGPACRDGADPQAHGPDSNAHGLNLNFQRRCCCALLSYRVTRAFHLVFRWCSAGVGPPERHRARRCLSFGPPTMAICGKTSGDVYASTKPRTLPGRNDAAVGGGRLARSAAVPSAG